MANTSLAAKSETSRGCLVDSIRSHNFWKVVVAVAIGSMIWLLHEERNNVTDLDDSHQMFVGSNPLHRCSDSDDVIQNDSTTTKCDCSDPLQPTRRNMEAWTAHHKDLVAHAVEASLRDDSVDVIMIGDSIIERWGGTSNMGRAEQPEIRRIFERYFTRKGGGAFDAVALGSAGDTSNNLLWHMENGLLPDQLRPKIWLMLVGTNDMGRFGCSKRTTLAGILHVAQILHQRRRGATIIVHALMPRSDKFKGRENVDYSLGQLWKNILWINRELKRFCTLHHEWVYMEVNRIFLRRKEIGNVDTEGALEINPETMEDALHPSVKGYELWAKEISEVIQKELKANS